MNNPQKRSTPLSWEEIILGFTDPSALDRVIAQKVARIQEAAHGVRIVSVGDDATPSPDMPADFNDGSEADYE